MTPESIKHVTITVTIRTPAGYPHEFAFELSAQVAEVIQVAVAYFVEAGQLAAGWVDRIKMALSRVVKDTIGQHGRRTAVVE